MDVTRDGGSAAPLPSWIWTTSKCHRPEPVNNNKHSPPNPHGPAANAWGSPENNSCRTPLPVATPIGTVAYAIRASAGPFPEQDESAGGPPPSAVRPSSCVHLSAAPHHPGARSP